MIYEIFAIVIALIHGFGIVFIYAGAILSILGKFSRRPFFEVLYIIIAFLIIVSFFFYGGCYLTYVEQNLWEKVDSPYSYKGGFISHYLSFIGMEIADIIICWSLVGSVILGVGSIIIYRFIDLKKGLRS